MKTNKMKKVKEFLKESNAIEDVWDEDSLKQAIYAWEYLEKQKEMSCSVVLKTHKILMLHQDLHPDEKGYFRKQRVWIGDREGMQWYDIPFLILQWCKEVNQSKTWKEIKRDHIRFEKIHPFIDGNGRSGRLLMLWQRIKCGLPVKVIWEKDKLEYYNWFEKKEV